MSGWKHVCWKQPSHLQTGTHWIAASVLLTLCTCFPFSMAAAQEAGNRITDISVSPNGELVINVEGEGFDPMLRLEAAPNGEYRIVVQGQGVSLSPGLTQSAPHLGTDLSGKIPAIDKTTLSGVHTPEEGFQLTLTAWRKLQPQVLSNSGNRIVIILIGERSIPPAVVAQRRQQELQRAQKERQRLALIKKQEALKAQAERQKQLALQHQEALKRQAEAALQAKQQQEAERRRLAEINRQAAAQRLAQQQQAINERLQAAHKPPETNRPQPALAELDDEQESFIALKRREAQRLAEQQRQALAHKGQTPEQDLEQEASATVHLTQELAKANSSQTNAQQAKTSSPKRLAGNASSSRMKPATQASSGTPTAKAAEWQQAYVADKPLSAGEFIAELQVAQQAGQTDSIHSLNRQISAAPAKIPGPSGALPAPTNLQQTIPVNFSGPMGQPDDSNAPDNPLRLKKLPPHFAPEPDPDATPVETPMNLQSKPGTPHPQQSRSRAGTGPAPSIPPGANTGAMQNIYAVINRPDASPNLRQAWQSLMGGNASAARNTLRQHLQTAPNDANARYLLAEILLSPMLENGSTSAADAAREQSARREEARQELLKNYAQSLHWPSCQALLELFLDEGKLEEASRLLAQVMQAYPDEAGVPYEQGRLQEAMDDLNAARTAYQQALSLDPANPEIHYRLAQVELKSGHLEAARWELLQALAWSPNDSRLYKLLGYIADKTGQGQEAVKAYRQALPVDAMLNYARALEAQNQPERALSLYQAVEALAGDNGDLLFNLAMIYNHTHRPTRAVALLNRFLALNSGTRQDARTSKAKSLLKQLQLHK